MKFLQPVSIAIFAVAFAAGPLSAQAAKPTAPTPVTRDAFTKNIDTVFTSVDSNKDGSLSTAELAAAETKASKQIESQILARKKQAFDGVDTNKDGSISFAEFGAAMKTPPLATDGKESMTRYDANKDGKVSQAEFRAPSIAKFNAADTNKDGTVSVEENRKASGAR